MEAFGGQSMVAPLRRALVRPPSAVAATRWREYGWRSPPEASRLVAQHKAFREVLASAGVDVVLGSSLDDDPDAIYTCDVALVGDRGAVVLRPGKEGRRAESNAIARDLDAAGVPVVHRLEPPAAAEGGDCVWLDSRTLLVGVGYRTSPAGVEALRDALPDVDVVPFDLPHFRGPGEVLHLLSFLSPVDSDLALVYPPLAPARLLQLLAKREINLIEVPDDEYDTLGCNVLALAPRQVVALDGNPETRRRLEGAGVEVRAYGGNELSLKGDGGPTCLTLPLLRSDY
jgi:N-dimethylarginine dimethylaminohydrolase